MAFVAGLSEACAAQPELLSRCVVLALALRAIPLPSRRRGGGEVKAVAVVQRVAAVAA